MVNALLQFYGEFHRKQYGWDGSPIHDAVAVAHVAQANLVETLERGVVDVAVERDVHAEEEPGHG